MTTRIQQGSGPRATVALGPTASRTTAPPARPFQQLMRASASAIVATAEQAATRLPGGPILAAALRSGPGTGLPAAEGGVSRTGLAPSTGGVDPMPSNVAGSPVAGGMEGVLAQNSDQNLYYLALQERISQESRTFTALSNVLKARHETVKNAITNIR